jgi:hypothetical protein
MIELSEDLGSKYLANDWDVLSALLLLARPSV